MKCAVANCNNTSNIKGIGFHTFPKDEHLLKQWVKFCRRSVNTKGARICSDHFLPEDYERSLQVEMGFSKFKIVRPGAVPTVNRNQASTSDASRRSRMLKRSNKKIVADLLKNEEANISPNVTELIENIEEEIQIPISFQDTIQPLGPDVDPLNVENSPLRESSDKQLDQIKQLEQDIEFLNKENHRLREVEKQRANEMSDLTERSEKISFELENMEIKLRAIFTTGQIKKIKTGVKKGHWSEEDIAHSIALYSKSAKAYRLLKKKDFPLPSIRTLQRWAPKTTIAPDIIEPLNN